jgi:hypothetical protein
MITPGNPNATQLKVEVIVSEDDNAVYVKLTGFDTLQEADQYADFLTESLPLMLFESEIRH